MRGDQSSRRGERERQGTSEGGVVVRRAAIHLSLRVQGVEPGDYTQRGSVKEWL